jgi:hypothetical protein
MAAVDQELMAYTEELKAWLQSFTALIISETKLHILWPDSPFYLQTYQQHPELKTMPN